MSGGTNQQGTPPDGGAELTEAATLRQQLGEATRQLAEAQLKLAAVGDNSVKLAEAERGLNEARQENLRLRADSAARDRATTTLAESTLPEVAYPRVIAAVTGDNVPLTEAGGLDEAKLTENITKAIERERVYLASFAEAAGLGSVRGLGDTGGDSLDVEGELASIFKGSAIGMSESSAATAAKGRA